MKRFAQFLIAVLACGSFFVAGDASARTTKLFGTPLPKLKEKARESGKISVLIRVRLDEPFEPEGKLHPDKREKQARDVRRAQEKVLKKHARLKGGEESLFDGIPHLLAVVDDRLLDELAADDDVVRIDEELVFEPILASTTSQIEAPHVWNTAGYNGSGYSVAILDSGVQATHPFLQREQPAPGQSDTRKVVYEACFSRELSSGGSPYYISTCGSGATVETNGETSKTDVAGAASPCASTGAYAEVCGHGTAVAGIAVGRNGSKDGVAFNGVAPGADVVAIQVMSLKVSPDGHEPAAHEGNMIRALIHVNTPSVRVGRNVAAVNLSIASGQKWAITAADRASVCGTGLGAEDGTPPGSYAATAMYDAVANLVSNGVVVVSGTGNKRANAVFYPACVPNILAVGGVAKDDATWEDDATDGSNASEAMDMWAPAAGWPDGSSSPYQPSPGGAGPGIVTSFPGSVYAGSQGTSFAVPHVAGAVAVLRQASPSSSAAAIISALKDNGPAITDPRYGVTRKRLNLKSAYLSLTGADTTPPSAPIAFTAITASDTSINLTWNPSTDNVGVSGYRIDRQTVYSADTWESPSVNVQHPTVTHLSQSLATNRRYRYRIQAYDAANNFSTPVYAEALTVVLPSNPLAFSTSITRDYVVPLRRAADAWRIFAGLPAQFGPPYIDPAALPCAPSDTSGCIKAAFFSTSELLPQSSIFVALNAARTALSRPAVVYSDSVTPANGVPIRASYFTDLLNGLR